MEVVRSVFNDLQENNLKQKEELIKCGITYQMTSKDILPSPSLGTASVI